MRHRSTDKDGDKEGDGESSSLRALWSNAPKQAVLTGTLVGGVIGVVLALFILWLVKEKPPQYGPALLEPVQAVKPRATAN